MSRYRQNSRKDDLHTMEGDRAFARMNSRRRKNQLQEGEVAYSYNGRMDTDGAWQPRRGIKNISGSLTTDAEALVLPFYLFADATGSGVSRSGDTVTVTFASDHELRPENLAKISGITGGTPDVNGNRYLTSARVMTAEGEDYYIDLKTGAYPDRYVRVGDVFGVHPYRYIEHDSNVGIDDPGWTRYDSVTDTTVTTLDSWGGTEGDVTTSTMTIVQTRDATFDVTGLSGTLGGTPVVSAPALEDTLINAIYASCMYSDPGSANAEYCLVLANAKVVAIKLSDQTETDIALPSGVAISAKAEMMQVFDRVYLFRAGQTALEWDGDLSGSPAFTKVASGTFTQPDELTDTSATISTRGEVAMNVTAHGLSDGDRVTVIDKGSTELVEGTQHIVQIVDADNFVFYADVDTATAGTITVRAQVSVGGGYSHMPAPPWASYFQRRLIMPYHYSVDASADSYTDREIRDELIASDVFDGDVYDPIYNQFRITAGIADYTVALQPFLEDLLLVFNRNSIHLLGGLSGSLADVTSRELTREVGCLARKSLQRIGNQILFLSDNGVYAVSFADEYNLRGTGVPLSEAIQDQFATINTDYADQAVSLYHDNRYYLAVPTGDSMVNNTIFIYNFLNQGWESIDQVQSSDWAILDLHVGRADAYNRPYAVNTLGGLHELESTDRSDGNDEVAITLNGATPTILYAAAYVRTRQYALNSPERARYTRFEAQVESHAGGTTNANFAAELQDPDKTLPLRTLKQYNRGSNLAAGEDASLRGPIRRRAYGCQMKFTATQGRPKLRGIQVEGHLIGRDNRPQR